MYILSHTKPNSAWNTRGFTRRSRVSFRCLVQTTASDGSPYHVPQIRAFCQSQAKKSSGLDEEKNGYVAGEQLQYAL